MNEVNNENLGNQEQIPNIQPNPQQEISNIQPVQQPQSNPVPVQPQPVQPGNVGNQTPNGNKKKSNNVLIICITLIIMSLSAVAIVYLLNNKDKDTKKENKPTTEETKNNTTDKTTNDNQTTKEETTDNTANKTIDNTNVKLNSNWINYLLSQNIIETKVSVYQPRQIKDSFTDKQFSLNKTELETLLNKMADSKLVKKYSRGLGGGPTDTLKIKYKRNNVEYEFNIRYGMIFIDEKDTEIIKLFDDNNYEENTENKEYKDVFYYYDGVPNTLFEDYIK